MIGYHRFIDLNADGIVTLKDLEDLSKKYLCKTEKPV